MKKKNDKTRKRNTNRNNDYFEELNLENAHTSN